MSTGTSDEPQHEVLEQIEARVVRGLEPVTDTSTGHVLGDEPEQAREGRAGARPRIVDALAGAGQRRWRLRAEHHGEGLDGVAELAGVEAGVGVRHRRDRERPGAGRVVRFGGRQTRRRVRGRRPPERAHAVADLLLDDLARVVGVDVEPVAQERRGEIERGVAREVRATTHEHRGLDPARREVALELLAHAALAGAGRTVDQREVGAPIRGDLVEQIGEPVGLGASPDETGGRTVELVLRLLDEALLGADHAIADERLALALGHDRRQLLELEQPGDVAEGVATDDDAALGCVALQARGDVHRVAHHGEVPTRHRRRRAQRTPARC